MKQERIGPAARGDEAVDLLASDQRPSTPRPTKSQPRTIPPMPAPDSGIRLADWRESLVDEGYFEAIEIVGGELGPIAAIGSPMVCVGFGPSWTVVWICSSRLPWSWSDPFKLFLRPRSAAACKYAVALAERVRVAAEAEQARRERIRAEKLRERFSFLDPEPPQ